MKWCPRSDDPAYEELLDEQNRIVAAFGPNPFGMMGQNWKRGWVFDPETTNSVGTQVFAPHQTREVIRASMENLVVDSQAALAARKREKGA